jgi:hypothetical protein
VTDDFPSPDSGEHGENPEEVLGEVWNALDVLPAARSTPNLASSTIEMAAVSIVRDTDAARLEKVSSGDRTRWMVAGVIVAACLTAGFVTGSATSGNRRSAWGPELTVVIRHLDVLEEAGSVGFLEAFAQGDYTPPMFVSRESGRRGRPDEDSGDDPPDGPAERGEPFARPAVPTPELDAALADFQLMFFGGELPQPITPADALRGGSAGGGMEGDLGDPATKAAFDFEVNRLAFGELAPSQRDAYITLAETLADPRRSDLVAAARLWHAWVTFADPVERAGLVKLPASERVEWLERRMRQWRRFMPGRSSDDEREEDQQSPQRPRSGGGRGPGGPPRRSPDATFRFDDGFRQFGGSSDSNDR